MITETIFYDLRSRWINVLGRRSNTLFSYTPFPEAKRDEVLTYENYNQANLSDISVCEVDCSGADVGSVLAEIPGMQELAYLQRLSFPTINDNYFVGYRAINFPTPRKIRDVILHQKVGNGEQVRLKGLYDNSAYQTSRVNILSDPEIGLQILPQERIVDGLPVFNGVTDAIGVHNNFRDENLDAVLLMVIGIPLTLMESNTVNLWCNPAVVREYSDGSQDFKIPLNYFKRNKLIPGRYHPSRQQLGRRGIYLYEMYLQNFPRSKDEWDRLGIQTQYFLAELRGIDANLGRSHIDRKFIDDGTLNSNHDILFGMWGGPDGFGAERNPVSYLPFRVWEVKKNV